MQVNYTKKENFDNYPVKTYGRATSRPYQQYSFDETIKHVKTSIDPAVIVASVGAGKSLLIAMLSRHVSDKGGKVLVLSRTGEIIAQDAEDCWLCECKNSLYSASLGVKSTVYPVILGTEGTVFRSLEKDIKYKNGESKTPSKLFEFSPDLILIDENHMVDFETEDSQYMQIISELKKRNPKVRIIGLTGTPYRGIKPIIGQSEGYFWKKQLTDISTDYLTSNGYLVPCEFGFGHDDTKYDLDEFKSDGNDGTQDFTSEQLRQMEKLMLKAETTTEKIMLEVMEKTKDRGVVMITCAGKKHCEETARLLPDGSYGIVTDSTSARDRRAILKKAYDGEIKYLIQITCLTVGINIPLIDTIVILRKIGSLTLLVQLIGRGLRLLKPNQVEQGIKKDNCLILDYTDTFNELGELYFNPMLEEAKFSKAKEDHDFIQCPKCGEDNSKFAVRCRGESNGERCDFFWSSRKCEDFYIDGKLKTPGCGAENAPTARSCRICDNILIDHNANLSRKHYKPSDYKPLLEFKMSPTKNNGIITEYHMPNGEAAKIFYSPFGGNKIAERIYYNKFVKMHCNTPALKKLARSARNAGELCSMKKQFDTVSAITHRVNTKGESVITKFLNKE